MDLLAACRVFVHVAERSSFTDGAAIAGVPQSVASRRVAALESRLGGRLFDRTTRRTALTPFGEDVLPAARRLVDLADAFERDADRAALRPLTVAVPDGCPPRALAELSAAARAVGSALELVAAPPRRRDELVRSRAVRCALVTAPADAAAWSVPLGLAGRRTPPAAAVRLAALRPSRARPRARRVWVLPEDDVGHVGDELVRAARRSGLTAAQIEVAPSLVAALAAALAGDDLVLCTQQEARDLALGWRALQDPELRRGHRVAATAREDGAVLAEALAERVGRLLGAVGADR